MSNLAQPMQPVAKTSLHFATGLASTFSPPSSRACQTWPRSFVCVIDKFLGEKLSPANILRNYHCLDRPITSMALNAIGWINKCVTIDNHYFPLRSFFFCYFSFLFQNVYMIWISRLVIFSSSMKNSQGKKKEDQTLKTTQSRFH